MESIDVSSACLLAILLIKNSVFRLPPNEQTGQDLLPLIVEVDLEVEVAFVAGGSAGEEALVGSEGACEDRKLDNGLISVSYQ